MSWFSIFYAVSWYISISIEIEAWKLAFLFCWPASNRNRGICNSLLLLQVPTYFPSLSHSLYLLFVFVQFNFCQVRLWLGSCIPSWWNVYVIRRKLTIRKPIDTCRRVGFFFFLWLLLQCLRLDCSPWGWLWAVFVLKYCCGKYRDWMWWFSEF